ncbi:hypothetical protein V8F20_012842, partial [Naviculisporaceae sp. PSN 640]
MAFAAGATAKGVWATPHDSYSSSIGVLGCKINTDRVAYWPGSVDCNNICVKLSYQGRSVHLLRIDQSGGAYDISYDAWAYLQTGEPASANPIAGGTVAMDYEEVDASECASLIHTEGNKLPLSASNSINFLSSCLAQPNSWVAKNHVLYNICDAICTLGHDEVCKLDLAISNQPSCAHTLGLTTPLTSAPVFNVLYQTGKTVIAGTGEEVSPQSQPAAEEPAPVPVAAPVVASDPTTPAGGVFQEKAKETTTEAAPVEYEPTSAVVVAPPVPTTSEEAPVVVPTSTYAEVKPTTIITSTTPVAPYPTAVPSSFGGYNTTIAPVSSKPAGSGEVGYTTLIKTTAVNLPGAPSSVPT